MPTTTTTTHASQMQHVTRTIRSHQSMGKESTGKITCEVESQQGLKAKSKSKLEGHLDSTYHTTTPHSRQANQLTIK